MWVEDLRLAKIRRELSTDTELQRADKVFLLSDSLYIKQNREASKIVLCCQQAANMVL